MQKIRRTRGPQRFAAITYPLLAEWTGLSLNTVRTYGRTGVFDPHDLPATLAWVNCRRARLGRPLIGLPKEIPGNSELDT